MENKVQINLRCPKCGKNLSVLVSPGMNISNFKLRCAHCMYVGNGAEFLNDVKRDDNQIAPQWTIEQKTSQPNMRKLAPNCLLKNGKYKILKPIHDNYDCDYGGVPICYCPIYSYLAERNIEERTDIVVIRGLCFEGFRDIMVGEYESFLQNLISLNHKGIAKLYDFFDDYQSEMHYIVTQYVEGDSLKKLIRHNGCFQLKQAMDIVWFLLDAVEYMNSHSVLYTNIAPCNIVFTSSNESILIGLENSVIGEFYELDSEAPINPYYMWGDDIYSISATFYEMLTGKTPRPPYEWGFREMRRTMEEYCIPSAVIDIIEKSMAESHPLHRKEDRYAIISEFRAALENLKK